MIKTKNVFLYGGFPATLRETKNYKALKSETYNFLYFKSDGRFVHWNMGEHEPQKSFGKSDIELFTIWSNIWKEKFNIYGFSSDLKTNPEFDKCLLIVCGINFDEIKYE